MTPETGNLRSFLLHWELPFVPGRRRIHAPRGKPGSSMVKNLPHGPSHDWTLDRASRPITLQDSPSTAHTA